MKTPEQKLDAIYAETNKLLGLLKNNRDVIGAYTPENLANHMERIVTKIQFIAGTPMGMTLKGINK